MENEQKKTRWRKIKDTPLIIIITIIFTTASTTSAVIIFAYEKLIIEHYKLEIQGLNKIVDQQTTIKNLDSIANGLRSILEEQIRLYETNYSNNQISSNQHAVIHNWKNQIDKVILEGGKLLKCDPADNKTFEFFHSWRNECVSLLNQIDMDLNTNYEKIFITLTKIYMSDYPQLQTRINDGLKILKTIRLYY
jgi:hypothetical protein